MEKNKMIFTGMIILGICILAAIGIIGFGVVSWTSSFSQKTISATGEAEKIVAPDQAVIGIGYTVTKATAADAQSDMNTVMDKVIAGLKASGIADADIKTTYFDVSPAYNWSSGTSEIYGYTATHNIDVKTTEFSKAGAIIDTATQAGANQINSVRFELKTDTEKTIKQELFTLASQDARTKADSIATGLGTSVKSVKSVSISDYYYPPIMYAYDSVSKAEAGVAQTSVSPGELTVSVSVNVEFLI
ncbi:MAG: SIMPL domain-containing protein [Candidatus Nanoarchaeia archaeon]|nr:SIMPL domain-containing protein [Candidatus Nanoarchaeia archaeon]MDD5239043.1 SIMPL domain-containing protein [Candidatus Nanoarchaeia archaeon]